MGRCQKVDPLTVHGGVTLVDTKASEGNVEDLAARLLHTALLKEGERVTG